ncbi:MAG: pyridoxal phosphate-dependent aminotransferase [Casimicrobiaceae bacterium]
MDDPAQTARRVAAIAPFHVMEVQTAARALEAAGIDVVHMEIGEPDFATPEPVCMAAKVALDHASIHYTSALGLPELRQAIAEHYRSHYAVAVDAGQVIVTAGSSAALLLVLALVVDRDDEILMADPNYPCNRHLVRTLEGVPVSVACDAHSRYQLTAAQVERQWTARTRGVLVASPSNPTGTTIASDELSRIAATVAQRRGHLIVDEIYLGLTYGERPRSVLALTQDAFVISGFSKYFSMTGWRLGWIVAPRQHVRDLEKLAQNLYISPPTLSQRAALACFGDATMAIVESRRKAFAARRDFLVRALRDLGFGIAQAPDGGFFIYADCSRWSHDGEAFCRDMLASAHVAITPGIDFGQHAANRHVRFAYTTGMHRLHTGVERLAAWLPTLPRVAARE